MVTATNRRYRSSGRFNSQLFSVSVFSVSAFSLRLFVADHFHPVDRLTVQPPEWLRSFGLERSHVDREAVLHVRLEQSLVSLVDFLDRNDFDIGRDVMLAAKIEHLLGFGDATDGRAGETAAPHDEAKRRNGEGLRRSADKCKIAVDAE